MKQMMPRGLRPIMRSLGFCAALGWGFLLGACGDSTPPAVVKEKVRAGAEQSIVPTATLPRVSGARQYDTGTAPENEERGLKVGAAVRGAGGQDAQKEKDKKDQVKLEEEQAKKSAELERAQKPDERSSSP